MSYNDLSLIPIDYSWSFSDKTQKDTNYITHGIYTYPAKFIPHLASRLICEYSNEGDSVLDPMMGSGTVIVESLLRNRIAFGSDINEIAYLITKVKAKVQNTQTLEKQMLRLQHECFNVGGLFENAEKNKIIPENERIDYWFKSEQKEQLGILLFYISQVDEPDIRDFFLVCFAQILKSTSIWLQKSVKPTRDMKKQILEPFELFFKHAQKMIKKNDEYSTLLSEKIKNNLDKFINIKLCDSRNLMLEDESIDLIITSPPYVTSYEYADLHQLPLLWFGVLKDLPEFRKKIIGSSSRERQEIKLQSYIAEDIVSKIKNRKAIEVKN